MAKTRLQEYWDYYLKKHNRYKLFQDRNSKYERDMAYNDYKKKGGKRKILVVIKRAKTKKFVNWKNKARHLIKLKSTPKSLKKFYRWCLKTNSNPF